MHKDKIKNLALILMVGVALFSMIRYAIELKMRFKLQDDLVSFQSQVTTLTQEKQNLLLELGNQKRASEQLGEKNAKLKAYSKASQNRLTRLFREKTKAQTELEDFSAKFSILKAENRVLIDSRKRSNLENEQLKLKLGSVVELKKAIRELRLKKPDALGLETGGNQGFLIKDGRSTTEKIRIKVTAAPYKVQQDSRAGAKTK